VDHYNNKHYQVDKSSSKPGHLMEASSDEEQKMTSSVSVVAGAPSGHSGKGSLAQLMIINIFAQLC